MTVMLVELFTIIQGLIQKIVLGGITFILIVAIVYFSVLAASVAYFSTKEHFKRKVDSNGDR